MRHPLCQYRAAAAHDSCNALRNQRQVLDEHASVDGHVIHPLFSLLFDDFQHHFGIEVFYSLHPRDCFVDRNCANRDRGMTKNGLANFVNVAAGREVHHRIGTIVNCRVQFVQFIADFGCDRTVADVGVDFAQ